MKTKIYITAIVVLITFGSTLAQDIKHPWWVFDKGGGTSQSGDFSLIGSFGQTGIGTSTANSNILESGFIPGVEDADMLTLCIAKSDVKCFGGSDGSITATPAGGTPPYQFSLDKINWQSDPTFSDLPPGNYTVYSATDICTTQTNVTINQPGDIICKILKPETIFNCRTSGNILCVTVETAMATSLMNGQLHHPMTIGTFMKVSSQAALNIYRAVTRQSSKLLLQTRTAAPIRAL